MLISILSKNYDRVNDAKNSTLVVCVRVLQKNYCFIGIWTLSRKMTSFRFPEYIFVL